MNKERTDVINRMNEKTKVISAEIIVAGTKDKPYFEIKYKEVGKDYFNIGFGSYFLENVFGWREEYLEIVKEGENVHTNNGWIPCSERLPEDTTYEEYMKMSFCMLDMCEAIYILHGWSKSCGANREYGYAIAKDKVILYQ